MIAIRPDVARALPRASWIVLLCTLFCSYAVTSEPNATKIAQRSKSPFAHLTEERDFHAHLKSRSDRIPYHAQHIGSQGSPPWVRDLKFTHLTTSDGLSQGYVVAILQD